MCNTALTALDFSHNNLGGKVCAKKITEFVRNNTALMKLDISHNDSILGVLCADKLRNFCESNKSPLIYDNEDSLFLSIQEETSVIGHTFEY